MPGQAVVRVNENEWAASLATTYAELVQGLSGVPSMAAGTGMLFVLPTDQPASVTTQPLQFNIDIIFISAGLEVVDIARNVAPGYIITESTPVRYFLEVNAEEASDIKSGDMVGITIYQPTTNTLNNWISPLVSFVGLMAVGTFMASTVRSITKVIIGEPSEKLKLLPQVEGKLTRDDVTVDSWVERDRIGIWMTDIKTGKTIAEWWDEDAAMMFEDGWFKPGTIRGQKITGRDFEESVLNYAEYIGVLEKSGGLKVPYLPQAIERGDVIEIPFKEALEWVQSAWKGLHPGSVPRVRVYRTTVARIHPPTFEYAVRDIVAHKAGKTVSRYVPSYESLLSSSPEEKALYFGGAVTLHPDEMIAVMDYWGDRFKSIDLYVHPVAYEPPKLIAPPITDRQMKILATIRAYTPAYRKEVFREHKVTQAEFDELQRMGLIDRRGAITVMGRNVVGRQSPLDKWGAWPSTETKEGYYLGGWKPGDIALYTDFGLRSLYVVQVMEWPEKLGERFGTLIEGPYYLPPVIHDRQAGSVRAKIIDITLAEWDFPWYGQPLPEWHRVGSIHYYHYTNLYRNVLDLIRHEEKTTYPEVQTRIVTDLMNHPGWEMLKRYGLVKPTTVPEEFYAETQPMRRLRYFIINRKTGRATYLLYQKGDEWELFSFKTRDYTYLGKLSIGQIAPKLTKMGISGEEYHITSEPPIEKPIESPRIIPSEPRPRRETDLEYLADSPEFLAQTIADIGYRDKLDTAFQEAIARAKQLRSRGYVP